MLLATGPFLSSPFAFYWPRPLRVIDISMFGIQRNVHDCITISASKPYIQTGRRPSTVNLFLLSSLFRPQDQKDAEPRYSHRPLPACLFLHAHTHDLEGAQDMTAQSRRPYSLTWSLKPASWLAPHFLFPAASAAFASTDEIRLTLACLVYATETH